jgi:formate dehydrogenase subunit gamma
MAQSATIKVTTVFERIVHWVLAISCLLLLLTGLGLMFKSFTILARIFGGTIGYKVVHDVAAWFFMISLVPTFFMWLRDCSGIDSDDIAWFKGAGGYLTRKPVHFNMGKFNPGQKMFFWFVIFGGIVMSLSGLALMYPDKVARTTVQLAGATHVLCMVGMALFILVHVYLGTIGNPGSVTAILTGRVTKAWGRTHRPKWMAKYPNGLQK